MELILSERMNESEEIDFPTIKQMIDEEEEVEFARTNYYLSSKQNTTTKTTMKKGLILDKSFLYQRKINENRKCQMKNY